MFANVFFGYLVNFVFALSAIPISLTGIGQTVHKLMFRAVPAVLTGGRFRAIVTPAAVTMRTIPVSLHAGFVERMSRLIAGTTPSMLAGGIRTVTGTVAVVAVAAPPVMRATVRFRINPSRRIRSETVDAEPVTVRARIRRCMMRLFAGGTCPAVLATFGIAQNLFAGRTRVITVRTNGIDRMSCLTRDAIPDMRAGLSGIVNRFAGRTIPEVCRSFGTNEIRLMMFAVHGAKPVMFAIFPRVETFVVSSAKSVKTVGALIHGGCMFSFAPGAIPIVLACRISVVNTRAVFTEPIFVTGLRRRMPILAVSTPPQMRAVDTGFINAVTSFLTAITAFFGTCIGLFVTVLVPRAPPGMFAYGQYFVPSAFAGLTIPVIIVANGVKSVLRITFFAVPAVLAVRLVGGRMVCLLVDTIPVMGTTCRFGVGLVAVGAIPTAARALAFRYMMHVANGTPPQMRTDRLFCQNFIAGYTETIAAGTIGIDGNFFAGVAVPKMGATGI